MSKKDIPNIKDVSSIPDELVPVIQWWNRNGKKVSVITAIVLIASAILYWVVDKRQVAQDYTSVGFAIATTAEEFKANREQGEPSAVAATIAEARALNVNGEYEAALALCADLSVEDAALKDACLMNKAVALEGLKRFDEAMAAVDAIAKDSFLKDEVVCAKARFLCQKGDKAAAKALLTPVLETNPKAKLLMNVIDAYGAPLAEPAPIVETPAPAPAPAPEATPATPAPAPAPVAPVAPEATPAPAPATPAAQ